MSKITYMEKDYSRPFREVVQRCLLENKTMVLVVTENEEQFRKSLQYIWDGCIYFQTTAFHYNTTERNYFVKFNNGARINIIKINPIENWKTAKGQIYNDIISFIPIDSEFHRFVVRPMLSIARKNLTNYLVLIEE